MSGSITQAKAVSAMVATFARDTITTAKEAINPKRIVVSLVGLWAISVFTFLTFVKQFVEPLYRLLFAARHPIVARTPENRFVALGLEGLGYTFASNYLEVPFGGGSAAGHPRMHYIDECAGDVKETACETILCLHGEPTWSFLYRKMVPVLTQAGYRVVVPDMIGFGKSDKYVDMDNYNHELHTFALKHLVNELGLGNNITLVGMDWGGITGLSVVKDMPDRFSGLVLMNTSIGTGFDEQVFRKSPIRNTVGALPFLVWRSAISFFGTHFPIETFFRRAVGFGAVEARVYAAPFPDSTYKAGVAKWPLMVPIFRDDPVAQHMVEVKNCLRAWQKPALLMWGENDQFTRDDEADFVHLLPHVKRIMVKGAGHFLPETHGPDIADNIVKFLDKKME